uniref:Uncharacterized protein n=1 Tax=Arundo donax TaxID=35708 RepID=A0A0A9I3N0_ARUDO
MHICGIGAWFVWFDMNGNVQALFVVSCFFSF